MRWLLAQLFSGVTSLDSKFTRSLIALVFRPGRLGAEWLLCRRASWIAPVSLFLVVNLFYFIAPPLTDFNLPLEDHLAGQPYSTLARGLVERQVPGVSEWFMEPGGKDTPAGYQSFRRSFAAQSGSLSKTLLIVHVPLMAFALWLLYLRRRILFVDHFAIALHYWSFLLLMMMVVPRATIYPSEFLVRLGWVDAKEQLLVVWKLGLLVLVFGHLVLATRRAYAQGFLVSLAKAVPTFAACVLAHLIYRPLLFVLSVWTLS